MRYTDKAANMVEKTIWALLDERQGNTSQTLGVAEALGVPFEIKHISFNPLIRLPNMLINRSRIGIGKDSLSQLMPPWPDVVISTARRLGIVASYIKSQHPASFLAQIQWPGSPSRHFDCIAAPQHDGIPAGKNIFTTLGAPHRVTPDLLNKEGAKWQQTLLHLPLPRIAVLVGGSSRGWKFTSQHGKALAHAASQLANGMKASLLITTSRRTDEDAQEAIASHLDCPHYFHDWHNESPTSPNPYFGFLGLADIIIATGDSISMCSEACATGKPVYIYVSDDFIPPKHRKFLQTLFDQGYARLFTNEPRGERIFSPPPWHDATRLIAAEIRKRAGF